MSSSRVTLSARDRLRAECEQRGVAYLLARDCSSGGVILCEQCPCLVTDERYEQALATVRVLEERSYDAPPGLYLVWWNESGFDCARIGVVQ